MCLQDRLSWMVVFETERGLGSRAVLVFFGRLEVVPKFPTRMSEVSLKRGNVVVLWW